MKKNERGIERERDRMHMMSEREPVVQTVKCNTVQISHGNHNQNENVNENENRRKLPIEKQKKMWVYV